MKFNLYRKIKTRYNYNVLNITDFDLLCSNKRTNGLYKNSFKMFLSPTRLLSYIIIITINKNYVKMITDLKNKNVL